MRRMITDKEIEKIENLEPVSGTNDGTNWTSLTIGDDTYGLASGGSGATYTAGVGIDIDANNEITADIKAGSGIVVDTDLTDDSIVVMIDQTDIPYKSDLATVATSGDYNDLINKPDIKTEVAIGWIPDGVTRTDYNFSTDNLASLLALGLPIIATADTTNYPLNSNITVGQTYKLYGAALIVRDSSRYRVILVGIYNGVDTETSWLYANTYDNQQVYIKGFRSATLSNDNLGTTYINYGTSLEPAGHTSSLDKDTILALPEPIFVSDDNAISFNAGNSYFNNTVMDAMKGIKRINITPILDDVGNNSNNVASLTFAFDANLRYNPLSAENQVYINTVSTDGDKNYTYGFKNFRTDFIDSTIVPDAPTADGSYNLNVSVSSGVPFYGWAIPTTPTLTKTTDTLTFTYSDNTTGTLTVVTDVTLS